MKTGFIFGKRLIFFLAVNFIIVATLSVVAELAFRYFQVDIVGFQTLLVFYSLVGMGGAFLSLWMSKFMAVKFMGIHLIEKKENLSAVERHLKMNIQHLAKKAGLKTPSIGIYDSEEVNAFATGPSKSNALVAVSTGLLNKMNPQEVEGVLAHEMAHIANGDMVTMTLIQGVVNTMVLMLASILASMVDRAMNHRGGFMVRFFVHQLFYTLLYIPGSIVVCFFSRWREFRADRGGAQLGGKEKMLMALNALQNINEQGKGQGPGSFHSGGERTEQQGQQKQYACLKINNGKNNYSLFARLFFTHPPLHQRIKALRSSRL